MSLSKNKRTKVVDDYKYLLGELADHDVVAGAITIYESALLNRDSSGNIKLANAAALVAAVRASLIVQDITFTAILPGVVGNSFSIVYADTASAGSETVVVVDGVITIGIESGVSTATQVLAAFLASDESALLSAEITGTAGTAQVAAAAASLAGGVDAYASETFAGVATEELVQASTASAGDNKIEMIAAGSGRLVRMQLTGVTKTLIGTKVYASADDAVATTGNVLVGVIRKLDDVANYCWVQI